MIFFIKSKKWNFCGLCGAAPVKRMGAGLARYAFVRIRDSVVGLKMGLFCRISLSLVRKVLAMRLDESIGSLVSLTKKSEYTFSQRLV